MSPQELFGIVAVAVPAFLFLWWCIESAQKEAGKKKKEEPPSSSFTIDAIHPGPLNPAMVQQLKGAFRPFHSGGIAPRGPFQVIEIEENLEATPPSAPRPYDPVMAEAVVETMARAGIDLTGYEDWIGSGAPDRAPVAKPKNDGFPKLKMYTGSFRINKKWTQAFMAELSLDTFGHPSGMLNSFVRARIVIHADFSKLNYTNFLDADAFIFKGDQHHQELVVEFAKTADVAMGPTVAVISAVVTNQYPIARP